MTERNYSAPRPRPGQLKVQFGKLADDGPDIIYARGEGIPSADGRLLHHFLSAPRAYFDLQARPFGIAYEPSLIEELEARGYDIKTLKISIEKKDLENEPENTPGLD